MALALQPPFVAAAQLVPPERDDQGSGELDGEVLGATDATLVGGVCRAIHLGDSEPYRNRTCQREGQHSQ
jgi:hypothetical protein